LEEIIFEKYFNISENNIIRVKLAQGITKVVSSSLRDFCRPLGNNNRSILIPVFLKDDILACVEN
jgi:hypothetical protein